MGVIVIDGCPLDCCAETGVIRAGRNSARRRKGEIIGTNKDGYVTIRINAKHYRAHRIIWFYAYGVWPTGDIDHVNGVRNDNRIANLREVSRSVNMQNLKAPHTDSKSALLGVTLVKDKYWMARIRHNGKNIYLGCFKDANSAQEAYLNAKLKYHGHHFMQTSRPW